ncbi:Replication factor A protein 1 [Coemansia sp. S146]|nr:Replication factor A protein 1 [Coemansia sp. S146]
MTLLDASGNIRVTVFSLQAGRFFPLLESGKVYYIRGAQLCKAAWTYTNVNHKFELVFTKDTTVTPCMEETNLPQEQFNFVKLTSLADTEKDQVVDVLCAIKSTVDTSELLGGGSYDKKTMHRLVIVDKSGFEVQSTLWKDATKTFSAPIGSVVAFKVNANFDKAKTLHDWYKAEGSKITFKSISSSSNTGPSMTHSLQLMTVAQVSTMLNGATDMVTLFTIQGKVSNIYSDSLVYGSCSDNNRSGTVSQVIASNEWICKTCKRKWPNPKYIYNFSFDISDSTSQTCLQCLGKIGDLLLDTAASKMAELQHGNIMAFGKKIAAVKNKAYVFQCKTRSDTFSHKP